VHRRHREVVHLEARGDEAPPVLGEDRGVGARVGARGHHGARRHEPAAVVDVPVGVIRLDAAREPDHASRAEPAREPLLHLRARARRGLAVGMEQTRLGGDDRAGAVAVDRATLEDEAGFRARIAGEVCDRSADLAIQIPRRILSPPRIEAEPECERIARIALDEGRPAVAQPRVVGRDMVKAQAAVGVDARARELLARDLLDRIVSDEELHRLASLQRPDDLDVLRACLRECPGHVVGACGHASHVARCGSHSAGQRTSG